MPTQADMLPKGMAWIGKRLRAIEKRLDQLAAAPSLQNATLTGGAGLTITDDGQLTCVAADGTTVFLVGQLNNNDHGTVLFRSDDGSNAIFVGGGPVGDGSEAGVTALVSRAHNWIASDDPYNPVYGGAPELPVPMYCVGPGASPAISTTTDTEYWIGGFAQERAVMYLNIEVQAPSGTTIASHVDVQDIASGAWAALANLPNVTGATSVFTPIIFPQQGFGVYSNVRIMAKRTAGTGTGAIVPFSCIQRMSQNASEGASG